MHARLSTLFAISGAIAAAGFGLLAVMVVMDIFIRNLGLAKWPWLNELTEYLLTISTFGGAPWVLRQTGHVNVDILLRVVSSSAAIVLVRASYALGLVISVIVTWLAVSAAIESSKSGSIVFKNLVFPEWWMMVPVIWCFALCSFEFLVRFISGDNQ
ncbi:TRAP transporter small permease [Lentibacter sp. XHP0401]|uniref:TRAP transporter small permease n=1 Tax=Lentibacter sp. XHP0401 TaxID=2984334 RepID=UPI0021E88602|nr:TRAP transporter small permease [Lentibacter sp. XHP0401]MCV2892719.1 TRAP transporter small permease [Lentibacter sp. XHP0401]